jgi:hypothetical protein
MTPTTTTILILAGLSGDGTSNASIISLVNKLIAAVAVATAGFFAWHTLTTYFGGGKGAGDGRFAPGGGRHGDHTPPTTGFLIGEAVAFVICEGLLGTVWALVNYGGHIVGGVLG